jgi:hypothetical protein
MAPYLKCVKYAHFLQPLYCRIQLPLPHPRTQSPEGFDPVAKIFLKSTCPNRLLYLNFESLILTVVIRHLSAQGHLFAFHNYFQTACTCSRLLIPSVHKRFCSCWSEKRSSFSVSCCQDWSNPSPPSLENDPPSSDLRHNKH